MPTTDPIPAMVADNGNPFIYIEQQPDPDDPDGFQLNVKAGDGYTSTDHIVTILLLVVRKITGVSPDLYAKEIEMTRRLAAGGPLFDLDAEDGADRD